jgi:hypothetical protein
MSEEISSGLPLLTSNFCSSYADSSFFSGAILGIGGTLSDVLFIYFTIGNYSVCFFSYYLGATFYSIGF